MRYAVPYHHHHPDLIGSAMMNFECDMGVVPVSLDDLPRCSLTAEQALSLSKGEFGMRSRTPLFKEAMAHYFRSVENAVGKPDENS
ncbi:MAG: hypothetical protein LBB76_00070 [Azoarcus sp.]|jgi:hypothetical protein|nr:hypothetical protein [Azoarcus sp.]